MTIPQIVAIVREQDLLEAERDYAQLHVAHAAAAPFAAQGTTREGGSYFRKFAAQIRAQFAPRPKQTARSIFSFFAAKAKRSDLPRASGA